MNITAAFLKTIVDYNLTKSKLLLAVSGGIDSVVLCELSKRAGLQFSIAHCNFGLRDEESNRDEKFVRDLATKYNVDIYVKNFETKTYAETNRLSIQEAARELRYTWFEELRNIHGFSWTLLAHHANDTIETVLMNLFRGCGLEGLTGIPEKKEDVHCLRPMLQITRVEIENFAQAEGLSWVEDSSNSSNKYTRNFFRNEIIPQIKKVYPQAERNLLNTITRLQQTVLFYDEATSTIIKKMVEQKGQECHIPVLKLMKYKATSLPYEIIKSFGFGETAVAELIKLADAESGKYIANEHYRIIKNRSWFIVSPKTAEAQTIVIDKGEELILFDDKQLTLRKKGSDKISIDKNPSTAQIDAREVEFPLVLRKWKAGDYFYPLGMRKKKKLARFFIDLKLSKTEKEKVWVLESHKRIVWVVGQRIDDRFKIMPSTQTVLSISISSL